MLELRTPQDWEQTLQSSRPVLAFFWAPWCASNKLDRARAALQPFIGHFGRKVVFASINIDELPEVAQRHCAASFPTFALFSSGQFVRLHSPEAPPHELSRLLYQLLLA
jgi:thioredoxin 1